MFVPVAELGAPQLETVSIGHEISEQDRTISDTNGTCYRSPLFLGGGGKFRGVSRYPILFFYTYP